MSLFTNTSVCVSVCHVCHVSECVKNHTKYLGSWKVKHAPFSIHVTLFIYFHSRCENNICLNFITGILIFHANSLESLYVLTKVLEVKLGTYTNGSTALPVLRSLDKNFGVNPSSVDTTFHQTKVRGVSICVVQTRRIIDIAELSSSPRKPNTCQLSAEKSLWLHSTAKVRAPGPQRCRLSDDRGARTGYRKRARPEELCIFPLRFQMLYAPQLAKKKQKDRGVTG